MTSLSSRRASAQVLYEELYCARGDMENRIKEQQLGLFADRTSSTLFRTNHLRLYFSAPAYVLMHGLRRLGLQGVSDNCKFHICVNRKLRTLDWRRLRVGLPCGLSQKVRGGTGCTDGRRECG